MVFNSRSFCWNFLIFSAVSLGVLFAPGETPKGEQNVPPISDVRQNQRPPDFRANALAVQLRNSRRDLAAAPPSRLASELANAKLPSRSGKEYSLPGLDNVNLLAQPRFHPSDFHDLTTPGLNRGRVRRVAHPGFSATN